MSEVKLVEVEFKFEGLKITSCHSGDSHFY